VRRPHAGAKARQGPADLEQARVVEGRAHLGTRVEDASHLVAEDRRGGLGILDGERPAEAAAFAAARKIDEVEAADGVEQSPRRVADTQDPQRMARRVVGHPMRVGSADVVQPEALDEELAQLQHTRRQRLDLTLQRRVPLGERRVVVPNRPDARGRRSNHHLRVGEHANESAGQRPGFNPVAGVEVHLSAAGLSGRKLDLVPESLEQTNRRDACLRHERVREAGDEERYAHRVRQDTPVDEGEALEHLRRLEIETPSWGYGNSGTRFHVYPWPGAARDVYERIADAALVHKLTGCCPSVAIHIPWDQVDDWHELRAFANGQGIGLGAVNPNLFGDDAYRLGSLCSPDSAVRRQALDHCLECVAIAAEIGSSDLSLWLADGTNYPGQDDLRTRFRRLLVSLQELYSSLPSGMRMLVEYKFFEPAFYSTDLPDWGTAALVCRRLGPQAQILVDTGHHPQGTNVEQIVALLLAEGLLGGFHFNNRKYADDDLMAGSIDPFELFRIMREIAAARLDPVTASTAEALAFMIDQSHNIEGKIDAMIQSVANIQTAYAKALLVDEDRLRAVQEEGDVLGAHRVLLEAFESDVRPLLAKLRTGLGVEPDPVAAFRAGGYAEQRARERGSATVASAYESS
jgi:L-rhamnose isomerase / sugar isomerase